MDRLTRDELQGLIEHRDGWCVSLYMPTYRAAPQSHQNPIRFKNLVSKAEKLLTGNGQRAAEVGKLLEPAHALVEEEPFWQSQSDGLAAFLTAQSFRHFRLPLKFDELVVATTHFHVKPLLPLFTENGRFYVLALSQKDVRLYQGTRFSLSETPVPQLPKSIDEALWADQPQRHAQFHTGTRQGPGGGRMILHGQGMGTDESKNDVLRFCQAVDRSLHPVLRNERAPLVVAGVEFLLPIYKEANTYGHLMDEGIAENPKALDLDKLHDRAWALVEPLYLAAERQAVDRYQQLAGTGRTSDTVPEIVSAAYQGKVACFLVDVHAHQWGTYDPAEDAVEMHAEEQPGDDDLLDVATLYTLLRDGAVYALEPEQVPGRASAAAVLRY